MSERFEQGRVRYKIDQVRQKIRVRFDDKFGCRYLNALSLKEFLPADIMEKYKSRRKDGNTLQLKPKEQQVSYTNKQGALQRGIVQKQKSKKMNNSAQVSWLEQVLDMQYCYFKSLPSNGHISRNNKFKRIFSDIVFRELYPEIRCMIMIESQTQPTDKFIIQSKHEQHKESFRNGELIIYVQRKKNRSIKQIVKYLQSYTTEYVVYSLDEYCGMPGIRKEELSVNQIRNILEKVIQWLAPQIKAMAKAIRLLIKTISIYAPDHKRQRYAGFQGRLGLEICLQGMFQSLPQFYFSLQSLIKGHPLTIGKVENIQFSVNSKEMQETYRKEGVMVFFGSYQSVGIINLTQNFTNWVEFKRSLRKGLHIISEQKGFTQEQMQILIRQHREVENFINDSLIDFVSYDYKPIDEKSFFIRCERQIVDKFVSRAKDYLKKNERIQVKRQQFTTEFQLFLFKKLIQKHIQQKYPTVSFLIKDGLLYSRSKEEDLEDLRSEMLNQRRKMLKKIVRLPCVRQLKNSHIYQIIDDEFQNEKFCHENTTKTIHYLFNQKQNIYFRGLSSISQCHELLITIIDQYYEEFTFFMSKFQQNSLSLQKYNRYLQGKDQGKPMMDRMINYSMSKSKYMNEMLVWFVDQDRRGGIDLRRLKWDVGDFIEKFKHNRTLQFVIPQSMWTNQHYFGQFFTNLFQQLQRQSQTSKTTTINIFYQESSCSNSHSQLLQITRRMFQKGPSRECFEFKSQMRLTPLEIERILLMEGWAATYWDNENQRNGTLSIVNSFVFGYEKSRRKKQFKVPLILKPKDTINGSQFLLALKYGIYYKLSPNYQITNYQISSNPPIKKLAAIIQKYFTFLEYFVVYMNDKETEVDTKRMYFWQSTATSMSSNSKTLPGQERIKRFEINQEGKLIPKKNSEVDIFVKKVDVIPKYIIQTHVDFLTEVKKINFVNSNKIRYQK